MGDLKGQVNVVHKQQKGFNEKLAVLSEKLKNVLVEKQSLLESFKKLEGEKNDLEKLVEEKEIKESVLQEKMAEKDEKLELMLKGNEEIKNQKKRKWKLFCF